MRQPIEGKHLNKVTTVDQRTGKEEPSTTTKMMLMPAKEGTCEHCATAHEKEQPHNAQSMFYQYAFYNEHGRWPNWIDAMAHCPNQVREIWTLRLQEAGVDVDKGEVNPKRKKNESHIS